jgi:hypothetical protein
LGSLTVSVYVSGKSRQLDFAISARKRVALSLPNWTRGLIS